MTDRLSTDLGALAALLERSTVAVRAGGRSAGAGVVWHAGGAIVTNAHVASTRSVEIELSDGRRFDGRVERRDEGRDLALVRIASGPARSSSPSVIRGALPTSSRPGSRTRRMAPAAAASCARTCGWRREIRTVRRPIRWDASASTAWSPAGSRSPFRATMCGDSPPERGARDSAFRSRPSGYGTVRRHTPSSASIRAARPNVPGSSPATSSPGRPLPPSSVAAVVTVELADDAADAFTVRGPRQNAEHLTERERGVLGMLARGLSNKRIAQRLGLSEHTVKFHVGSILAKLGAATRTEAVTVGVRLGLVML